MMKTVSFVVENLTCPSCVNAIETALNKQEGVNSVKVLFHSGKIKINFSDETSIESSKRIIEKLGYPVVQIK